MAICIIHRLKKIKIHIKQSIRFFLFISYFHHFFKITFIKESCKRICISKVFKLMLLSHILCNKHDFCKHIPFPLNRNHTHNKESAFISGAVLQTIRILLSLYQLPHMLGRKHIRKLCIFSICQYRILIRNFLNKLVISSFFRIKIFASLVFIFISVIF